MATKKAFERLVSPKGTVVNFCAFPQAYEGELKIEVAFEGDEMKAAKKMVTAINKSDGRGAKVSAKPVDGKYLVVFKRNAGGVVEATGEAWAADIAMLDAKKKPMDLVKTRLSKGSVVRVAFKCRPTEYKGDEFWKLEPTTVQVLTLAKFGGDDDMFDEEEGYGEDDGDEDDGDAGDAGDDDEDLDEDY